MDAPGWLSRSLADVPAGDGWLGPRERAVLARLPVALRRASWRLGRWTAHCALAAALGREGAAGVEVLAAPDGAPEAWRGDERVPLSLSITHRAGRAVVAVLPARGVVGCDLERVEPRSDAFLRTWFGEHEQAAVREAGEHGAARTANLLWTAKEAAAKVRREGLRLDVRAARVELGGAASGDGREPSPDAVAAPDVAPSRGALAFRDGSSPLDAAAGGGGWAPLRVVWPDAEVAAWWRGDAEWVLVVAAAPPGPEPRALGSSPGPEPRALGSPAGPEPRALGEPLVTSAARERQT